MRITSTALILLSLLAVPSAFADEATQAAAGSAPSPANPHRAQDQRMHSCRLQAKRQKLAGEARSIFIARCVKTAAGIAAPAPAPAAPAKP